MSDKDQPRLTRRALMQRAGALGAGIAAAELAACAAEPTRPAVPDASILPEVQLPPDASFEYVIIGSGAGGGPLAANLARAGRKVLLIEAGSAGAGGISYQVPVFHAHVTESPDMRWDFFVQHFARPPAEDSKLVRAEGGILYPRAGTLGGCTAHHAMITVAPDDADWDRIAQLTGDASWSSGRMWRYLQRLERCTYHPAWKDRFGESGHGYDGWLPTSRAAAQLALKDGKLVDIVLSAARSVGIEALAADVVDGLLDPNDRRMVTDPDGRHGLFLTPIGVGEGMRFGTRDRILETVRDVPQNLTVMTGALATRILFDGSRAIGVEYLRQPHLYRADPQAPRQGPSWAELQPQLARVRASREVILAGGAFNSPQLLQLSGIGPAEDLRRLGIPVLVDRPGVGRNLQDRYEVTVVSEFESEFELLKDCLLRPAGPGEVDPTYESWKRDHAGIYATNGVVAGVIRKSRAERPQPDLYIFGLPGAFRGYYPGYSEDAVRRNQFCWAILKAHTVNRGGEVKLVSADPRDRPAINFHYFEEGTDRAGEDLDSVVEGVEFVRAMNRRRHTPAKETVPGPAYQTRAQIADFVRREAWGHHASCSNPIGPASDPAAVLDSNFQVHGVQGLRVVDASVFPRIPGLFIVSAVYMVSEKASDVILGRT